MDGHQCLRPIPHIIRFAFYLDLCDSPGCFTKSIKMFRVKLIVTFASLNTISNE